MSWINVPKHVWQCVRDRSFTERQRKWLGLCQSSRALKWMWDFWCPPWDDKPPPLGWNNHQLLQFAATLMNDGKADTLKAALLLLLYEDLKELIDERIDEKNASKTRTPKRDSAANRPRILSTEEQQDGEW